MRILVTGGCGFIGLHLCRHLIEQDHTVMVLDDLSTGRPDALPAGVSLEVGDVAERRACAQAVQGADACVHLAAIANVPACERDWSRATSVNLLGTVNVFAAAVAAGNLPVVYASSAAVYGDAPPPLDEAGPSRPLSSYGADKLAGELHAHAAGRTAELPTCGLRFFNVFGPGQEPGSPYSGVIARFAERLGAGEAPLIYGDGRQSRDFIYVGDVVRAIELALRATSPAAPVINVCTGHSVDLNHLAREMSAEAGVSAAPRFADRRAGDIRHSCGDPSRASAMLGFRATTTLRTGLSALLARD